MDCIKLAQKLAANNGKNHSIPMSPSLAKKIQAKPIQSKTISTNENIPSQGNQINNKPDISIASSEKRATFKIPSKHKYIVEFQKVFTDKNLKRYFCRFARERSFYQVLEFIDGVAAYKELGIASSSEKQNKRHQAVITSFGSLPSDYQQAAITASKQMSQVSINSFDDCISCLLKRLEEREFPSFLESPHYSKWTMKYHNVEEYNDCID